MARDSPVPAAALALSLLLVLLAAPSNTNTASSARVTPQQQQQQRRGLQQSGSSTRHGVYRLVPMRHTSTTSSSSSAGASKLAASVASALGSQGSTIPQGGTASTREDIWGWGGGGSGGGGGGGGNDIAWPGLSQSGRTAGPLEYGGGALLTNPITVHYVFYGNWGDNFGQNVLTGFVDSLSDSSADSQGASVQQWWQISTKYKDSSGNTISAQVVNGNTTFVRSSNGLNDGFQGGNNDVASIVKDQISQGKLPLDSGAFYAFFSSKEVQVGSQGNGFCGSYGGYCGWHIQETVGSTTIQIGFIGDGTQQCNAGCGTNQGLSATPNGYYSVDSLISTFAHELAEAASNPDTQSGYTALDSDGQTRWENADLCVGQFTDSSVPSLLTDTDQTYQYNLEGTGSLKFLVQTNVDLATQSCTLRPGDNATSDGGDTGGGSGGVSGGGDGGGDNLGPTSAQAPEFWVSSPQGAAPPDYFWGGGDGGAGGGGEDNNSTGVVPDSSCAAGDTSPCTSCGDPDGCYCFQDQCLPLCQVAAGLGGTWQGCSTCGFVFCFCGSDGQCHAPFG